MNYPLKPKVRRDPKLKVAIGSVVALVVLVLFLFAMQSQALFSVLGPVGTPLWKARSFVTGFISSNLAIFQSKKSLEEENSSLRLELDLQSSIGIERDAFARENATLKGLSGTTDSGEVASVLSGPTQSMYDIVIVELKADSQVHSGDLVFGPNHVVLGTVINRAGNLARIKYFSSPGTQTPARLTKDGSEIILSGRGGGNFLFVAPRDLKVSVGDIVALPSLKTSVLGVVGSVENVRSDSFMNVYISYPVSIFNISFVRIAHAS